MPAPLMTLVDRSRALYERVWRFDSTLYSETPQPADNIVMKQIDRLRAAAERGAFDPLAVWRKE
jgi:regulator of CtrA degradation